MPLQVVERIVQRALSRWDDEYERANVLPDWARRCARIAVVYQREARWWGVLARHTEVKSPYLQAVLIARRLATENARRYHRFAHQAEPAAQRPTRGERECAELGEHDWDNTQELCGCGLHLVRVCARCLNPDTAGCTAGGGS
jgi:hypothetical protein